MGAVPFKAACESGTVWYMMFETTCVKLSEGRQEFYSPQHCSSRTGPLGLPQNPGSWKNTYLRIHHLRLTVHPPLRASSTLHTLHQLLTQIRTEHATPLQHVPRDRLHQHRRNNAHAAAVVEQRERLDGRGVEADSGEHITSEWAGDGLHRFE